VNTSEAVGRRGLLGVFGASLAILVLEVALTRMFSVVMWYHFAFVAVSLAMLGLAVGGIGLYLFPGLRRNAALLLGWSCGAAAITTIITLMYLARVPIRAASAADVFSRDVVSLYLVTLLPFLFGGFAISAALTQYARQATAVYFYDLVGAGAGCVVVLGLLNFAGAPAAILAAALVFAVSGLLLRTPGARIGTAFDLLVSTATAGILLWHVNTAALEPVYTRGERPADVGVKVLLERWNSHSRISVTEVNQDLRAFVIDGNACTFINHIDGQATPEVVRTKLPFLLSNISSTPYAITPPKPEVLVIGPGGGRDVLVAMGRDAQVTAVELNGIIFSLMRDGELAAWSGNVYRAAGVTTIHDEARSWLRRTDKRFDLIQLSLVDTWAATSAGALTLAENALYTVDAFEDYFSHLKPDGVVHISRFYRDPPRDSLRTVVLMAEVMRRNGITDPGKHIAVYLDPVETGPLCASILWSRSPLSEERVARLEAYARQRFPGVKELELTPLHVAGKGANEPIGKFLSASDRDEFIRTYPFDVSPTTDDRPFFFNTVRLEDVAALRGEIFANEQAVVVLVTTLATVCILTALAFGLPFLLQWRRIQQESGRGTVQRLLYFCALGLGFLLIEIPALQRFGLYLGHPTFTLSTVLASFLLGAGLGSGLGQRFFGNRPAQGARWASLAIVVGVILWTLAIPPLLGATLNAPIGLRVIITILLLSPLGVAMGMPLPLGVRALERTCPSLIPWAWGMNGAMSVLASIIAVALGTYAGFTVAALAGAGCYAAALLCVPRLDQPSTLR